MGSWHSNSCGKGPIDRHYFLIGVMLLSISYREVEWYYICGEDAPLGKSAFKTIENALHAALTTHMVRCDWSAKNWRWYIKLFQVIFEKLTGETTQASGCIILICSDTLNTPRPMSIRVKRNSPCLPNGRAILLKRQTNPRYSYEDSRDPASHRKKQRRPSWFPG